MPIDHLSLIRRYLKTIEDGNSSGLDGLFADDMFIEQLPNRIYPKGIRQSVAGMHEAFEKGRKLLSSQTYEIKNAVVHEDRVAIEALWTGTLAIAFGSLPAGSKMRCHSAMFFEFRNGKISAQRNYDCFEPW